MALWAFTKRCNEASRGHRADTPDLGTETSRHGVNTEIVNIFMFTYKTFT